MKIVRSNVYVCQNTHGGVYEATEDPDKMRVILEQSTAWWEGDKLRKTVRQVEYFTDTIVKKGTVLPGNICIALQTDPVIEEEPEEHLWYLEDGSIAHTPDNQSIYGYFYYSPLSKFKCDTAPDEDDIIEHLTTPNSIY